MNTKLINKKLNPNTLKYNTLKTKKSKVILKGLTKPKVKSGIIFKPVIYIQISQKSINIGKYEKTEPIDYKNQIN